MEKLFEAHCKLLQMNHDEILKALEGLPPAALDWSPGPGMNSINVLVFHLTGSARYWIGDVAVGEPSNRDRDAEFSVRGVGVDILQKRLADSLAYAQTALGKLTLQDLEKEVTAPSGGRKVTVAWAVLHALEHVAVHVGHIELTRQLWEQFQAGKAGTA
jgi:uncharacterized damage-inducible protein DinB